MIDPLLHYLLANHSGQQVASMLLFQISERIIFRCSLDRASQYRPLPYALSCEPHWCGDRGTIRLLLPSLFWKEVRILSPMEHTTAAAWPERFLPPALAPDTPAVRYYETIMICTWFAWRTSHHCHDGSLSKKK
jgi:hypothetical protein